MDYIGAKARYFQDQVVMKYKFVMAPLLAIGALGIASCGNGGETKAWLGYAEGENALIAPPEAGWITKMAVTRGQSASKGALLFTLEARGQQASQGAAQAGVESAQDATRVADADVVRAQKELVRQRALAKIGGTARRDLEVAQAAFDAAQARRKQADSLAAQAQAQLEGVAFGLSERNVTARVGGRVEDIYAQEGEFAAAGTPVLSLLAPQNVYARFYIPEKDLSQVKQGQRVFIKCDGCADTLTATITFIASESEFTPPVIYSVQNRAKLVFKAEARMEGGLNLRPGLPLDVTPVP